MPAKRDALFINSFARPPEANTHDSQSRVITRPLVPSDMVAFGSQHSSTGPGLINQRLATTQYPGTKELLVPRDGVTPGWHEEFTNLIAQTKRSHILREEPPTLQHFMLEAPSIDFQVLRHMHAVALSEWQQENTDVFYITRNSINLAGPHHKSDLAMIEQKFCCGDLRDGKGLLEFVTGFKPEGSVRVQAGLLRALDTKLSASSSLTQIQVHCDSLLHTWQKIRGNDIAHPEAFYHYLLESFPLEPESGKIPRLRGWMAEQVTEESSALATPTLFIAKIVLHAQLLRVPDSEERVHVTTDNKDRQQRQQRQTLPTIFENDCDSCDAKCCASRKKGGRKACLCKHAHLALPEGATHGMKQFVALNRAYSLLHPTADLTKTSVEQMRAAVRKSKPAVLPVAQASETPDLSSDQMNLFRKWLAESQPPAGGVLMMTNNDYLPDPAQTTDGFSMLVSCEYCMLQHSPQSLWCALSMGMPERCPSPASGGCGRSQCERSCSCDMRQYIKEMDFRTKARVNLYESQKELHTVLVQQEADALIYRAAAELVSRAVDDALTSLDRISSTHSLTAGRFSSTRSLTLSPHEALKRCVVCRSFPCECRDDVEDECMVCNEVPCVCNASGGALEHALRSGPSTNGPRDDSPTTGGEPPAWPLEQVVAELTHAAQPCGCRVDPRGLHPLSGILLVAPTPHCAGFAFDPASALRMAAVTGGALQNSSVPIAAGCELCDTHFTCESHRGANRCDDGVPGCNCSQRGVSIGGAIPIGGADATDDDTTTDSELGACVGCCDTGSCVPIVLHLPAPSSQSLAHLAALTRHTTNEWAATAEQLNAAATAHVRGYTVDNECQRCTGSCVDGCNFAVRLKRRRPIVRVSSDEWPANTFKRPALYKRGDAVQFVAPDRRIQLRTYGTVVAVTYSGATPLYVVATTNTTSKQYTLAEHMLSHRTAADPVFALQGSELVLREAAVTTADIAGQPGVVLMLDAVAEDVVGDEFEGAEDGVQDASDDVAIRAVNELALAQSTVMSTFETRLQEHDDAIQLKLKAQFDELLQAQSDAHKRVLLAMEAQRGDSDRAVSTPASVFAPQDVAGMATAHQATNPRLVMPGSADFVTPAPREIPMQELMASPLQALRAGTLAMAETQRRSSFGKVFDLNSSGGTSHASPPERIDPTTSTKLKDDEASINEYYARAQLANAKMIRSYKAKIEALKQSTITYYINRAMLMSGKMLGFSLRRLSWAELGFLIMLVHTVLPHASPYFVPALRAIAAAVIRKGYAWKCHAVAAARAAALTAITGVAARISVHDATVVDQDSTDRRQFLQAALDKIEPGAAVPVVTAASGMVVMPVGNISAAVLPVGLADHSSALCDDGATIDCFLTLDGVIPGTFDKSQGGPLTIGDKSSSLSSNGVYLYAIERCGANGTCQDELFLGHHTPNGVANIMSESREVNVRQTRLEWCPGMARQFHTKHGASIPLIMGPNGLGFLTIKPITDRKRIVKLLLQSPLTPKWLREQMAPVVLTSSMLAQATTTPSLTQVELIDEIAPLHTVEMPTTTLLSPPICTIEGLRLPVPVNMAAPVLARQLAGATTLEDVSILAMIAMNDISFDSYVAAVTAASMALSGVGLAGKLPTLSPFMTLVRVHCLLGHATLNTCLATIACATSLPKGFITREAIREYLATKCGICESAKMRRRTFRLDLSGVKDHTVPEIGKQYVFDTLGLRVPSAQWGYINITRFNDRNPKGIKRSYGHISMDAETFEKLILTFRAFNRPYKGEILVMKKDGHPSHRSHQIKDLFVDSSMVNQESPPYVHEAINTENTFQWSVPSAMATLAGSDDGEMHFFTAFLYCERAENRSIDLDGDGISAEQRFTGRSHDLLISSLVYGSPCKYLQHPEVRDSKFDSHALPGRYRGPSREDESDHRCWVQSGSGTTMRHITVDIGCMRVDERSTIARCDRNHPSHQPLAIDAPLAVPAPDFSQWIHPGRESYEILDLWTASTPIPTSPTLVLIGAGAKRDGDGPASVKLISGGAVATVAIDHELGGYEHDWRLQSVQQRLIQVVTAPQVIAVIYMLNCNPWSALHCIQPGPPVLFDAQNLSGIRDAAGKLLPGVVDALASVDPVIVILQAAHAAGKQMIGETPVTRGSGSLFAFKETIYADHVNAFTYPPLDALHKLMGSESVYSDRSQVGAATQKTTEWKVTPGLLPSARLILGTLRDASYRRNTPETSLIAGNSRDYSKSASAARYTPQQWERLVRVALSTSPFIKGFTERLAVAGAEQNALARANAPAPVPASVQRSRREASDARYTVDGQLQPPTETRASLDKARRLRGQVACVDGSLVALHILQQRPPEPDECMLEDMAVMVLQSRHQQSLALRNLESDSLRNLDTVIEAVDVRCVLLCIETGETVSSSAVMALADGLSVPVHLDTAFSRDWHKPVTYRDYLRSPQRGLWRTAMELRMDAYKAIPLFVLVSVDSVLRQGFTIINTLWAFSIKYDEAGTFDKLNPRWCMMGGGMDRAKHESYAEVCRWSSVLIIIHIACAYETVTFSFDIHNAFQNTDRSKAFEPGHPPPTRMFCYQAPGFAEHGPDGEKLCCELLMLMQGAIDASRLFGTAFGHTLLKRAGARRALWDREVWEYHKGPLAASAESLEKILAACNDQPPAPGAPPGWAVFSKHTDDGLGAANAQRTTDHLMNAIGLDWACKASNWKKHLGYGLGLSACGCFCQIDCIPVIEALYQRHMGAHNTYRPKHPYPMNIGDLKPGVRPPLDSPERAPFDEMQAKCQNGLATSIWISRAHTVHAYSTNFLCGMMSNPSYEVYKCWQHSLMAERASPCPLVLGSGRKVSLSISADPPRPFSGVRHREMGFHVFVDADLGTPKARALGTDVVIPPISEGRDPTLATIEAKSVSGIRMYLGGIEFISSSLRQHLTSPDPHTSEIGAAGTAISMALPLDGLLRELHIFSDTPIPIYCDSQSTIFASRSAAATKRSVWIERRTIVLREFVELRECTYHKIDGRYNVADGSTKPIPHATWLSHRSYSHPYFELSDAARSVVAAAFHVAPDNPGAQALFDTAYAALTAGDRFTVDRLFMLIEGG